MALSLHDRRKGPHQRSTGAPRYRVVPYPIHGLIEADVTAARQALRRAGAGSSFTAFVVATVAQAVGRHAQVNARRVGRRLVLFDGTVIEREMLPLTLSFDHSVVDGAPAARFAATLQRMFETAEVLTTQTVPAGGDKSTAAITIASDRRQR